MDESVLRAVLCSARAASVFDHTITSELDVWRADPLDVASVHAMARARYSDAVGSVRSPASEGHAGQGEVLVFYGPAGAGKTHLIRALRSLTHATGLGYLGYAQLTPELDSYSDFYLRRLLISLEKPHGAEPVGETSLMRLSNAVAGVLGASDGQLEALREHDLDGQTLGRLVAVAADQILLDPRLSGAEIDINVVRALLYLQRRDPSIDQRVRHYLSGRTLAKLSQEQVTALDPHTGSDRALEIIEALGRLAWALEGAALVFCLDQVEDLRFAQNAGERFAKAVRDLIQIANRLPRSVVVLSCLDDFYAEMRPYLPQSYIDRIERRRPVALRDERTAAEARALVLRRVAYLFDGVTDVPADAELDAALDAVMGADFFVGLQGMPTRKLLAEVQARRAALADGALDEPADATSALLGAPLPVEKPVAAAPAPAMVDEVEAMQLAWERFVAGHEPEIPTDDQELVSVITAALRLCQEEVGHCLVVQTDPPRMEGLAAVDVGVQWEGASRFGLRVFVCNKGSQGGGLKVQVDKVMEAASARAALIVRTTEFNENAKTKAAIALRRFIASGGRKLVIGAHELRQMLTLQDFRDANRGRPGFAAWQAHAQVLSALTSIRQILRFDLGPLAHKLPLQAVARTSQLDVPPAWPVDWPAEVPSVEASATKARAPTAEAVPELEQAVETASHAVAEAVQDAIFAAPHIRLGRLRMGGPLNLPGGRIALPVADFRRHAAVLGGSGSGKTVLAVSIIEQMLLQGIPAILIDRKGDLASYANGHAWGPRDGDTEDRAAERERLRATVDVALYTPGKVTGRPINLSLLPEGIAELPTHERNDLAKLSASAVAEMLKLGAAKEAQLKAGVLASALELLSAQARREVRLSDLIALLNDREDTLAEITVAMDERGKQRKDLAGLLDSLRVRNRSLFESHGEPLSMDALLGLGSAAIPGKTKLSIISTSFLGDNDNITFWVAQFLSEALRFCQRNPSDALQALIMLDEADLYIPANSRPATKEPLEGLLKRARSAGVGIMLATQSPGDLDYKSRDQITSWFIGRVREDTALKKLKAAFGSSGIDPADVLPQQGPGEFHFINETGARPIKTEMSLIKPEQVPFERIEHLASGTRDRAA